MFFSGTSEPYWAVGRFKGMDGFWVSVLELEDSPRWPKALGCKGLHFTVAGFHVMEQQQEERGMLWSISCYTTIAARP